MLAIKNTFVNLYKEIKESWIGLNVVLAVALLSRFLHGSITNPTLNKSISEILLAVLLGLYIGNAFPLNSKIRSGAKFALQRLLRLGIILLGLRLSLQDIAATGLKALIIVFICISVALTLAYFAGRIFKVPPRLAALIGVGTAICGNTAIVATAPVIDATEEEMGFAVATITLFGLLAVLIYPLIGYAIGLSDKAFGLWAGTAVNDTSQVVAVAAIYSETSLNIATIVKLTRNTMMAPLIMLFGLLYSRRQNKTNGKSTTETAHIDWKKIIPGFVIGFLVMVLVRSLGVYIGILPQNIAQPGNLKIAADLLNGFDVLSKFLILMALAGVGINTNLGNLRKIGLKPLLVGTSVALVLAVLSISLILFTPLGG